MMDEGYIKFQPVWTKTPGLPPKDWAELNRYRQRLYNHRLIGAYDNGIGYGNISQRYAGTDGLFVISGSATGNVPELNADHYALVTDVDIDANRLHCRGPIVASSESMSHAVIYQELPWVQAVIHIHNLPMWQRLLQKVPTTDAAAAYGTPEMAYSIIELIRTTDLPERKLFVMQGHEEGVFAFGRTLAEALSFLLSA